MRLLRLGIPLLGLLCVTQIGAQSPPNWLSKGVVDLTKLVVWASEAQDTVVRLTEHRGPDESRADALRRGEEIRDELSRVASVEDAHETLLEAVQSAAPPRLHRPIPALEMLPDDREAARRKVRDRQVALVAAVEELQNSIFVHKSLEELEDSAATAASYLRALTEAVTHLAPFSGIPEIDSTLRAQVARLLEAQTTQAQIVSAIAELRRMGHRALTVRAELLLKAVEQQRRILEEEDFALRWETERLRGIAEDLDRMYGELEEKKRTLNLVQATVTAAQDEVARLQLRVTDLQHEVNQAENSVTSALFDIARERSRIN